MLTARRLLFLSFLNPDDDVAMRQAWLAILFSPSRFRRTVCQVCAIAPQRTRMFGDYSARFFSPPFWQWLFDVLRVKTMARLK